MTNKNSNNNNKRHNTKTKQPNSSNSSSGRRKPRSPTEDVKKMYLNAISVSKDIEKKYKKNYEDDDLLDKGIDFLRGFAGLAPEQIYRMSINEFLQKMETYYSIELQALNNHDVHLMSKILDYLVVGTRKMLEMTEAKEAELKKQKEKRIGKV